MTTIALFNNMPSIEINTGADGVRKCPLKQTESIIGRNPFCDLLIDSGGISRRHSRIFRRGEEFYIEDLNSINGTFVNRNRVTQATLLHDGDTIHFYRVSGVFRIDTPDADDRLVPQPHHSTTIESKAPTRLIHTNTTSIDSGSSSTVGVEQRLEAVLKVVDSLGRSLDLDEVLANILDGLFDVFPQSRRGNIWLIDPVSGAPALRATKQTGSQTLCSESLGPLSMSITDDVIARRQAILNVDEINDRDSCSIFDFHLKSSMCAPLTGPHNELLGAICIESDDGDRPFAEADLHILTSVSAVAGQATEYARQHERLIQNAVRLTLEKTRREQAEEKLSIAESVQRSLYPARNPEVNGFDIAGAAYPTEKGCGDYFDFIELPDGRLAIAVGDVSGHGLGAALYMVQTRSYIRSQAALGLEVSELLSRVNNLLCVDLREGTFVTLFLAILDPATRLLTWASAGHSGIRVFADGHTESVDATGLVLGLVPNFQYSQKALQLASGDILFLPTDGFQEAMNGQKELFGHDRMMGEITGARNFSATDMIEMLCSACRDFAGETPIQDDMTCVLVKVE